MARITLRLYGKLKKHGSKFDLYVDNAKEAMDLLYCQIEGLKNDIRAGYFDIRIGGNQLTEYDLDFYSTKQLEDGDNIHIIPRVFGAGKIGQAIAGVALIAFSLTNPFGWAAIGLAGSATIGSVAFGLGVGLLLGGIAQMLIKQPKMTNGESEKDSRSYGFSNIQNIIGQGMQVPIIYGNVTVGSYLISQGVSSMRIGANEINTGAEYFDFERRSITMVKAKDRSGVEFNTQPNDLTYNIVEV